MSQLKNRKTNQFGTEETKAERKPAPKPKLYWIERKPDGSKRVCMKGKITRHNPK